MSLDAMKQALEALEFLALENFVELDKSLNVGPTHGRKAIIALRAAIEQAQEPVAWMHPSWIDPDTRGWESDSFNAIPIEGWVPVFTAPRQWQGLMEDEIVSLTCECVDDETFNMDCALDFARAIEAKLKEKNT